MRTICANYARMENVTLIKAWIPTPLHRAVKSAASQHGLTIQDFVMSVLRNNPTVRAQERSQKQNGKEKR